MPTYHYASYLPEAIDSVLAQDFADFELLIIDDCSPDNTAEVVKAYCAKDKRIRFERNPANLGMVNNWNHCLKQARGRYIKFLFGDDKLADEMALTKLRALLENHPSAALAASARIILDAQSNVTGIVRPLPDGCHFGQKLIGDCLLDAGNPIGEPSAVLFRKDAAGRGFNPAYRQFVDLEMWFHLLERGDLAYTAEPLCAFRRHARQQTAVNNAAFSLKENLMLIADYGSKPFIPVPQRLDILYRARRSLRRDPAAKPQFLELEQRFTQESGKPSYLAASVKYKIARPLENLRRARLKRRP
jgi:glycosyltransferase involved in cell wall biosynthesis